MLQKILLITVVGLLLIADIPDFNDSVKSGETPVSQITFQVPDEIQTNCYSCHDPKSASHDAILAPPLAVVKMRYNRKYGSRAEFVKSMTSFLLEPTNEKAIMYGAVDRFGVMPATVFDEETTRRIVEYIYSNKLEEPTWLAEEMGSRSLN